MSLVLPLQAFENGVFHADLSDTPPHVIAAVLKLYLRQVSKSVPADTPPRHRPFDLLVITKRFHTAFTVNSTRQIEICLLPKSV